MKKIVPFDDYNHRIHPDYKYIGSILPTFGNDALTNGWKLIEIYDDKEPAKRED